MSKRSLLFWGPVLTASGYGEHARQLLRSVVDSGEFDVYVHSVKWGSTPFLSGPEVEDVERLISKGNGSFSGGKPDVFVQVTIPNEFMRRGKFNIGITAGIEVDRVSPEWIRKTNENVDLLIVPSGHSAHSFADVSYQNQNTGEKLRLEKPVLVVPESFDGRHFNTSSVEPTIDIGPDFNFLSVGLGLDRGIGEDRKNIGLLVKLFCQEFAGDKDVGLVLKTGLVNGSVLDRETTVSRIKQIKESTGCGEFPRIKLIHGRLSVEEMAALYKHPKIKAYVTLTHGEGYGLPIVEAAACGLPVIATNWSGHLDFLKNTEGKKRFVPVDFKLNEVPPSFVWKDVVEKGTRWACVDEADARAKMRKLYLSYDKPKEWATEQANHLAETLSASKIGPEFVKALVDFIGAKETNVVSNTSVDVKTQLKEQLSLPEGKRTLLYTMPMSAGDVFISSGVVNSLRKKFPEHYIVFATQPKYASIVQENPDVDRVVSFESWMMDVSACEKAFDEVYTPNLAVQLTTSNWVHGGKGRLLGHEFAAQCGVEFGDYSIKEQPFPGLPDKYIVVHTGSGKGQWEARNYRHWKKVVKNLIKICPSLKVVHVGLEDDPSLEGTIDLRGKTTYNQLASVVREADCVVSIDSVVMHMAAAFRVELVAIFGSSYSTSTGPVCKAESGYNVILLDSKTRGGCEKACYKYTCAVDKENPCVNEIDPKHVLTCVLELLGGTDDARGLVESNWDDCRPKIAGYTTLLNPDSQGFPYVESIRSMLGFCDEVVVVDGRSDDGSLKRIEVEINDPRVKVFHRKWDESEPGMDGMQKAYARAMTSVGPDDFLWQQDADEVVHERDYEKIRNLVERFPTEVDVLHLPVVELWGSSSDVRTDRHSWKWRLSRNSFRVTHGINKNARVMDDKTGRTYAKKGMSDGCEYVDVMTGEFLPHKGFYTKEIEQARVSSPDVYGQIMNSKFKELPSVFHYSWVDIPRKIRNFKQFWNRAWSNLYNDPVLEDRFPDANGEIGITAVAEVLKKRGGEHGPAKTFKLEDAGPELMKSWVERHT